VIVDKNRLWVIGAVLVIGAVVVLGWILGISPKLTEAAANDEQQQTALAQNAVYEAQVAMLKGQFEDIGALKADLTKIQLAVPGAAEIPAVVAEFTQIAGAAQVGLSSLTVSEAQAYDPALAAASPVAAVPADAATPAPAVANPAVVAGLDSRIAPTNFITIPLTVTVDGSYDGVLDFVSGLQHGSRLVLVNAVSITEPASGSVTGTITALVYVLLNPSTPTAQ